MITINFKMVARTIGIQLFIVGILMLCPLALCLFGYEININPFLFSFIITSGTGALMYSLKPKSFSIKKREGYLIVAFGWILMCCFGALPYILNGSAGWVHSIFESTSGFTTTGASIFENIEGLDKGILLWRSLTQWIGGMGIIVFTIAIFPILGIGGVELFVAESPGPTAEKIHPRIAGVAKRLWLIYVSLTITLTALLYFFGGMAGFDSVNHAMTTMSTGGFSTKNASIAHFNSPTIEYIISLFMLVGGVNYTILYFLFKGKIKRVWKSEEFKFYIVLASLITLFVTGLIYTGGLTSGEQSFRYAAFNVISLITTTGYVSVDYLSFGPSLVILFFLLLFLGGSAGSTSGGIKMIRHLVFFKNAKSEIHRILHPRAYIRLKIDDAVVPSKTLTHILVFLLFYMILFIMGSFIFSFFLTNDSTPFLTSIGAVATSLGNVGPAIGSLGPVDNFAHLTPGAHVFLAILMVIGRLELFTILIIFSPRFWKPT